MATDNGRANTLEYLIVLNRALSNALDALEIARDLAKTPADRQQAENEIPAVVQAKTLLKSKTDAFIVKPAGVGIKPPTDAEVKKTQKLAEDLAKVDAQVTKVQKLASMTAKVIDLISQL